MKRMVILATPIVAKDLEPGDLFSVAGPDYWDRIDRDRAVGERLYVRTNTEATAAEDASQMVFKITVATFDPLELEKLATSAYDPHGAVALALFNTDDEPARERAKKLNYMLGYGGLR